MPDSGTQPQQSTSDRDVDLLEIDILSQRVHTAYSTWLTALFSVFIGTVAVLYTLQTAGLVPWYVTPIVVVLVSVATLVATGGVQTASDKSLSKLSKLLEDVRKGERLPTLEEAIRTKSFG